jgi:predicted ferric reductase
MAQNIKRFLGTIIVLIPVFAVVVIWFFAAPVSTRFVDFQSTLLSIGRIAGLIGLALYAISFVLHVRIFLEPADVFRLHHDFGSLSLIMLLVHPLVLAFRYFQVDPYYAAKFLVPTDNLINLAGLAALGIMIGAMLVTYYYKANHTLWLWVHRSMLVAYLGSFLHLIFVTSDTSASPVLKYYIIFLMATGLIAFVYQRVSR